MSPAWVQTIGMFICQFAAAYNNTRRPPFAHTTSEDESRFGPFANASFCDFFEFNTPFLRLPAPGKSKQEEEPCWDTRTIEAVSALINKCTDVLSVNARAVVHARTFWQTTGGNTHAPAVKKFLDDIMRSAMKVILKVNPVVNRILNDSGSGLADMLARMENVYLFLSIFTLQFHDSFRSPTAGRIATGTAA
jgi:hypothetical protein